MTQRINRNEQPRVEILQFSIRELFEQTLGHSAFRTLEVSSECQLSLALNAEMLRKRRKTLTISRLRHYKFSIVKMESQMQNFFIGRKALLHHVPTEKFELVRKSIASKKEIRVTPKLLEFAGIKLADIIEVIYCPNPIGGIIKLADSEIITLGIPARYKAHFDEKRITITLLPPAMMDRIERTRFCNLFKKCEKIAIQKVGGGHCRKHFSCGNCDFFKEEKRRLADVSSVVLDHSWGISCYGAGTSGGHQTKKCGLAK